MIPKIITSKSIFIIGLKDQLSYTTNAQGTSNLARLFMPRVKEILNPVGKHKFSIQIYNKFNYNAITPNTLYEKWVGIEVYCFKGLPEGLQTLTIESGKYAIFNYKGKPEGFMKFWQNIHTNWLPNSEYELDDRPHFEKLPEDYHPTNPEVEEEIWVPIK